MRASTSQLFGDDFYQDEQIIRIQKSSLFLSQGTHSGEAILATIVLRTRQVYEGSLTDQNGEPLTVNGQTLDFNNANLYDNLTVQFWRQRITLNRQKQQVYECSFYATVRHEPENNEQSINLGKL